MLTAKTKNVESIATFITHINNESGLCDIAQTLNLKNLAYALYMLHKQKLKHVPRSPSQPQIKAPCYACDQSASEPVTLTVNTYNVQPIEV